MVIHVRADPNGSAFRRRLISAPFKEAKTAPYCAAVNRIAGRAMSGVLNRYPDEVTLPAKEESGQAQAEKNRSNS